VRPVAENELLCGELQVPAQKRAQNCAPAHVTPPVDIEAKAFRACPLVRSEAGRIVLVRFRWQIEPGTPDVDLVGRLERRGQSLFPGLAVVSAVEF
jgi:hypothetical protein